METILGISLYCLGGAVVGIAGAWAVRQVARPGSGIMWRADGWPHGVQEEEPRSFWGATSRTPTPKGRGLVDDAREGVIEELSAGSGVPVQPVRR